MDIISTIYVSMSKEFDKGYDDCDHFSSILPFPVDPPCTPLVRGVKNYFPEGVKMKKSQLSLSFSCTSDALPEMLSESCPRSSAPLHLLRLSSPANPLKRDYNRSDSFYGMKGNLRPHWKSNSISKIFPSTAGATIAQQTNLGPLVPRHQTSFRENFIRQKIDTPLSHPHHLKDDDNISKTKIPSIFPEPMQKKTCILNDKREHYESEDLVFPDIFLSLNFSGRTDSSKENGREAQRKKETESSFSSFSTPDSTTTTSQSLDPSDIEHCDPLISPLDLSLDSPSPSLTDELITEERKTTTSTRIGFKVIVRIKPLDDQDSGGSSTNRLRCVQVKNPQNLVLCTRPSLKKENPGNRHMFQFDHVLDESSTQKDTYDVTTQPLVEMTLQGYHSCLVTYGFPGTGKSHALFGKASSGKYKGLIIRAADALMSTIDKTTNSEKKTEVSMSFIQLYNEKFYDILDPSATDNIKVHESVDGNALEGVTEWPVETSEDVTKQLRRNPNRVRDAGRSHTIFTLYFRKEEELEPDASSALKTFRTIEGRLDFVDLVGVNRTTKHSTHDSTGNNATAKANKSLQVFSNVIMALSDSDRTQLPPYRDSRLTRLLKESLGGNCITHLLVTASSCPNSAHETLSCLSFAKHAMFVKNFPAPYVSIEKIPENTNKDGPTDDKDTHSHLHSNGTEQNTANGGVSAGTGNFQECSDNLSISADKPFSMKVILSSGSKEKSGASSSLPPINVRSSVTSNSAVNESLENAPPQKKEGKEGVGVVISELLQEITKTSGKSNKKRGLPKDSAEAEAAELKRKNDKFKKSRRKSKSKTPDSPASTTPYWQINGNNQQELLGGGHVIVLPQIESPDQMRHENIQGDAASQESKSRQRNLSRKQSNLTDISIGSNSSPLMYSKELPFVSRSSSSLSKERSILKSSSNAREKNEKKEAFCSSNTSPAVNDSRSGSKSYTMSPEYSSNEQGISNVQSGYECCTRCQEREEKIKRDYDRMILFSKKDRDIKQSRIEELEILLYKAHSESAPLAELQRLTDEKQKDRQALKKHKEMLENYKTKLGSMVDGKEVTHLQELRKKDITLLEEQKAQIETLKRSMEEQTNGATKMLSKKSEQIAELNKEIIKLKSELSKKEDEYTGKVIQLNSTLNQALTDKEKAVAKQQSSMKEVSLKLTCALAQVSKLQEANAEAEKLHEDNKETMKREMSVLSKQVADLSKSKKKHDDKKLSNPLMCDSSMNTEDIRSKLNGLAYSVNCLRCAAKMAVEDESSDEILTTRDAELRILLLQDTKNRELLLQMPWKRSIRPLKKRERNLLRDVMKIMYCRQWFTEEGNPHVKRTLKRVGIDPKELEIMKKY